MQAAAAAVAALTLLGVILGPDFLSAQQPDDTNTWGHDAGGEKKNQPHIVFILIDDQVCVCV